MPEEYQVLYPSPTTEKEVLASIVIEDGTSHEDKVAIRTALRSAAEISLAARGIFNIVPGARTIQIEAPRKFDELEEDAAVLETSPHQYRTAELHMSGSGRKQ